MSPDDPNDDGAAGGRDPFAEPPGSGAPGDDPSPQRFPRAELRRKVSLKFKEFQGFVNEYSENVSAGGMFIRTTSPQPVGTVFDFELTLGDDYTLIHGLGEVAWVRERDEGFDRPSGMGVRFLSLDPGSRKLIDRMVAERLARGGPAGGLDEMRPFALGLGASGAASDDDEAWWGGEAAGPARTVAVGADDYREAPSDPGPISPPAAPAASREDRGPTIFEEPARPRGGPSPYIYSRTYQGAGYSKGGGGGRSRTLLVVLLVLVSLVAALAAFALLAPGTVQSWLMGDARDEERLVAREPANGEGERGTVEPVEPVAPEDRAGLTPPPVLPGEEPEDEEAGFFSPAEEPEAAVPEPEPEPAPEPAAPTEEPSPIEEPSPTEEASPPFSRVLNVVWEERGEETLVTVHLDGAIEEWNYSTVRLGDPARELVRIEGVDRPFARPTIPVGTALVERVRLGYHPEGRIRQMHVVVDLADPTARLDRTEAAGSELRLWFAAGDG